MANVVIWHPELNQSALVDEQSVGHYRAAGWLTKAEHDANEREAAQRAAAQQEQAGQGEQQQGAARKPAAQPGTGRGTLSQQHDAATGGTKEA